MSKIFILPTERALLVTQVLWTCAKVNYREVPILISVSMDTVHLSLLEVSIPEKENTALIYWIWCNFHQDPLLIPLALFWLLIVNRHLQIEATFKKFDQTGNDKLNLREFGEMMNKRSDQGRKKSETSKKEESQSEGNSTKSWSFDKLKIMISILH